MQVTSDTSGLYQCPLAAVHLRQAPTFSLRLPEAFPRLRDPACWPYPPHGTLDSSVSLVHLLSIHSRPLDWATCSSMQVTSDSFRLNQCPLAANLQRQASSFIENSSSPSVSFGGCALLALFVARVVFASRPHNHYEDLTTPRFCA